MKHHPLFGFQDCIQYNLYWDPPIFLKYAFSSVFQKAGTEYSDLGFGNIDIDDQILEISFQREYSPFAHLKSIG